MSRHLFRSIATIVLCGAAFSVHADNDIEGQIQAIDPVARTLTVQGITFHTDRDTDYDDGLYRFEDLRVDQKVEVDFVYRDDRHIATEIELED